MAINRRQFLKTTLRSVGTGITLCSSSLFARERRQQLLSCSSNAQGEHFATMVSDDGNVLFNLRLPARGHGIAIDRMTQQAVVFARRPGDFMVVIDLISYQISQRVSSAPDRHYCGHGVFSHNGRYLFTTENAYELGEGRIGIYDAFDHYKKIGELPSHGIGPHELAFLNDGKTLAIANGGVRTHPDLPRIKQNLSSMTPNLAYIDSESGQLLDAYQPPKALHQLSIRHLDVSTDNSVAIAMQYQGSKKQHPPLVALHKGEDNLTLLKAPKSVQQRMRNYCGSVTFSNNNSGFAVSAPRGGLVSFWSANGDFLGYEEQQDACGIAQTTTQGYWISDGVGNINKQERFPITKHNSSTLYFRNKRWDNHLISI